MTYPTPTIWLSKAGRPSRVEFELTTQILMPNQSESFILEAPPTIIVLRLEVSVPAVVEVYGTEDHDSDIDVNPYRFRATSDHLIDDGSTYLSTGEILKVRNYSIFANLESPTKSAHYVDVTNISTDVQAITLKMLYLAQEADNA